MSFPMLSNIHMRVGNIEVLLKTGHNDAYRGALKDYFEIDITDNGIGIDKNK